MTGESGQRRMISFLERATVYERARWYLSPRLFHALVALCKDLGVRRRKLRARRGSCFLTPDEDVRRQLGCLATWALCEAWGGKIR